MKASWLVVLAACGQSARPAQAPAVVAPPTGTPAALIVGEAPGYAFEDPARRQKLEAAFPAIDALIERERKAQALPGIAIGIVIDGELAYAKGAGTTTSAGGPAPDADTVYRIGSITKSFTGLALLAARDDGALHLDDPLAKWVPAAAKLVYPTKDARPLTLRQLATHTSGLTRMGTFEFEAAPTETIVTDSLGSVVLGSTPGTHFEYSNLGFGLLGIAIAHATRSSFHEVVATKIWKPLGMTSTSWDPPAARLAPAYEDGGTVPKPVPARLGAVDGAGGIYSTVRDMAKYIALQLSAYPARSDEDRGPIRRATLREAHATGYPAGFRAEPAVAMSYGFGWSRFQTCALDDLVTHNGGIDSYRADLRFSPSRGVGVVALTNFAQGNPGAFTEKIFDELAKTGAFVPRAAKPSPALAQALARLLGIYHAWDEAAFAKILTRPIRPEEKGELATYHALHGTCTTSAPARIETPLAGSFAIQCERGILEMHLDVTSTGQINGFFGRSTGVAAPPAFEAMARELVALANAWDDKRAAKLFVSGAPFTRAQRDELFARHGACKIAGLIHVGFEWGITLACDREDVEVLVTTAAADPTKIARIQWQPRPGAPARCAG